jgi:hypothetical protein
LKSHSEAERENTFLIFQEWCPFSNENWRTNSKKGERAKNCTNIYTDISYHERTDLRVTEYRYPPFDWVRETSNTKFTPKQNTKQCEKKNQSLYTGSVNSIESFSTEILSK